MTRPAAVLTLAALALAGCGKPTPVQPSPPGPTAVAREFFQAIQDGDSAKSWAMLDKRTRDGLDKQATARGPQGVSGIADGQALWADTVKQLRRAMRGEKPPIVNIDDKVVETLDGDLAWVRAKDAAVDDKGVPFILENGLWKIRFADFLDTLTDDDLSPVTKP